MGKGAEIARASQRKSKLVENYFLFWDEGSTQTGLDDGGLKSQKQKIKGEGGRTHN